MQKVSKQSLAMLALSILLAISIALTFTFAAASASKTATGEITFTGTAALVINGFDGTADAGTFTVNIAGDGTVSYVGDEGVDALEEMSFGLTNTSAPAYVKVLLEVTGPNVEIGNTTTNKVIAVNLVKASSFGEISTNAMTTTSTVAASTSWKLSDVLKFSAATVANYKTGASTVKLTITADTVLNNLNN